jgi:hypothetical protein
MRRQGVVVASRIKGAQTFNGALAIWRACGVSVRRPFRPLVAGDRGHDEPCSCALQKATKLVAQKR